MSDVSKPKSTWMMDKVGKPIMLIGIGFILCKIFDAYTAGKNSRRIEG